MIEPLLVNLPIFEGPLDLLLYLIRRDELDIWDIPISRITDEFLQYIETLQELNLDVAGDFLVMASTLTQIKSRLLLPSLIQDDDEEAEDPRLALVQRLLEYERYSKAAKELTQQTVLGRDAFNRQQVAVAEGTFKRPLPDVELWDLLDALKGAFERAKLRGQIHHIDVERFSVVDQIHWLHDRLQTQGAVGFQALFDSLRSRMEIVLTFLAMLEMLKRGILSLNGATPEAWQLELRADEADLLEEAQAEAQENPSPDPVGDEIDPTP